MFSLFRKVENVKKLHLATHLQNPERVKKGERA
jgi:hypothetical protein